MPASLRVTVNGRARQLDVEPHHTLLEVLRADLRLTGTKECCLVGECGACTVILDGRSVDSCLVLALEANDGQILTVEALAPPDGLDTLQQSFLDHAAAQCGFCIPGQLMAARALLDANPDPTRADVEEGLAGNLCRCAGYEQIIEATLDAAGREAVARDGRTGARGRSAAGSTAVVGPAPERAAAEHLDPAAVPDADVAPQ